MPETQVLFFCDEKETPVRSWLVDMRKSDRRAYAKCIARLHLLAQLGHELRRPLADYLEQEIHELRIRRGRVNYRILYFFHGSDVAILTHGLIKEDKIPRADLARAILRRNAFLSDPEKHTFEEDIPHA
jgi:phage-related protein